jgi:hypothetical protein
MTTTLSRTERVSDTILVSDTALDAPVNEALTAVSDTIEGCDLSARTDAVSDTYTA